MKGRKKTFPAIARLSRAAREIMERAFLQGPGVRSVSSIQDEIKEKTGEKVDDNAIYRYREYWLSEERPFIEARQQADAMLAALKDQPTADLEELVKQRLTVAQVLTIQQLDQADPVELGYLAQGEKRVEVQRERNRILKERTENDRKKIALLEEGLKLREKQWEAAKEKAGKAAETLDGLERRKKISPEIAKQIREELYGIVDPGH